MKTPDYLVPALICMLLSLFCISCDNDDDVKDTSLLVGRWLILNETSEEDDKRGPEYDIYYNFDGQHFWVSGIAISSLPPQRYVYDQTTQIITIDDNAEYKVLKLTNTDLEMETEISNNTHTHSVKLLLKRAKSDFE